MSERFADAARSRGLIIQTPIPDGLVHRTKTADKPHSRNGAYTLFENGNGWFQNHADGLGRQEYRVGGQDGLTAAERHEARVRVAEQKRRFLEAQEAAHRAAALEAKNTFGRGYQVSSHPYLRSKGVGAHGIRVLCGALLVPILDVYGNWQSLQRIFHNGSKTFLKGGKLDGGMYTLGSIYPDGVALICEGYSTGATIFEATGCATVISFNCGNIVKVAIAIRNKFPDVAIVICADDDHQTRGNPGMAQASAAARAVGGVVAKPNVKNGTDFNDMCAETGMEDVQNILLRAIDACMTPYGCGRE